MSPSVLGLTGAYAWLYLTREFAKLDTVSSKKPFYYKTLLQIDLSLLVLLFATDGP